MHLSSRKACLIFLAMFWLLMTSGLAHGHPRAAGHVSGATRTAAKGKDSARKHGHGSKRPSVTKKAPVKKPGKEPVPA